MTVPDQRDGRRHQSQQQRRESSPPVKFTHWFETLGKALGYIIGAILASATIALVLLLVAKPLLIAWNWVDTP